MRGIQNINILEQQIKAVSMKCRHYAIGSVIPFYVTFKERQNVFTPDKVLQACQRFCCSVERVVNGADGGYIEGRSHNR